jgi:hypothetical protein
MGTANPVPVSIAATNIPLNTVFSVRLLRQFGDPVNVGSTASTGTFASSTATANVTLPPGEVSLLLVSANFTLPQIASLFPLIDGEPVERIMVAAAYGQPSTVTLITRSGREVPAEQVLIASRQSPRLSDQRGPHDGR